MMRPKPLRHFARGLARLAFCIQAAGIVFIGYSPGDSRAQPLCCGSKVTTPGNTSAAATVARLCDPSATVRHDLAVDENDFATIERFCDRDDPFMALIVRTAPDLHGKSCLSRRFRPPASQPGVFWIGQRRIAVVANPRNPIERISIKQVGVLLAHSDRGATWEIVGGERRRMSIYDEGDASGFRDLLREKCLRYSKAHLVDSKSGAQASGP